MKPERLLRAILPDVLIDNFDIVNFDKSADRFDIYLDEKKVQLKEDKTNPDIISYGFGEYRTIQDYPIRGRATYLHVRKRKWLDKSSNEIFSYDWDLSEFDGTRLNSEFVSFLKEGDWIYSCEHLCACRTLWCKGQTLRKQYKEKISDYRNRDQLEYAHDYLLYPENIGENLSLDETCLSNGDVYTILINKAAKFSNWAINWAFTAVCEGKKNDKQFSLLAVLCRNEATRTPDPYVPNVVRYQLRYIPFLFCECKGKSFFWNQKEFGRKFAKNL